MQTHRLTRMMTVAGLVLTLGMPLMGAQQDQGTSGAHRGQLSERDYRFLEKAAQGGLEEVQAGELARQKGVSQAVRNFGEHMVTQHTQANNELKQLATQKGATLPTQLAHHERSTLEDLQKASGTDFDKTYARNMVKDHKKDVKEFQNAAKDLKDPNLRAFARKTLPVLEEHLRMADAMESAVKKEK